MSGITETAPERTAMEPPGPRGYRSLGNLPAFRRDPIGALTSAWQKYGDLVSFQLGALTFYVVSHPELVQEILVNARDSYLKLQRPDGGPAGLQLILGNGLVTNVDQESWRVQRRMIQPMFHRKQILALGRQITDGGDRLLARWEALSVAGMPLDLALEMNRVTLDVINQTMFGADVMEQIGQIGPAVNRAAQFTFRYETSPIRLPLSWPTPGNRQFSADKTMLYGVIDVIIDERRQNASPRGDLLDMLLAAQDDETGAGMSDQQLRDEVLTIFAAGHETTAQALTWSWYLLATHQEKLLRMQQELDQVLAGRTPTAEDLPSLPYTRAVLDESMRLYPPVPVIPRLIAHDSELGGYLLRSGKRAVISVRNVHRHPAYWSEPNTFKPERFLPDAEKPDHRLAYMPFGAGPRLCVGSHLALVEGALLLAQLGQKYSFQLAPGQTVTQDLAITLRPKNGLLVILEKRKSPNETRSCAKR